MQLASEKDDQIWAAADPLMDNLMKASTAIDHAAHTRDFTARLKAVVTPEHLEKVCKRYQAQWGTFTRREPVAIFRRAGSVAVVWKQYLSNTDDQFVAEMVLIEDEGKLLIDHVEFF